MYDLYTHRRDRVRRGTSVLTGAVRPQNPLRSQLAAQHKKLESTRESSKHCDELCLESMVSEDVWYRNPFHMRRWPARIYVQVLRLKNSEQKNSNFYESKSVSDCTVSGDSIFSFVSTEQEVVKFAQCFKVQGIKITAHHLQLNVICDTCGQQHSRLLCGTSTKSPPLCEKQQLSRLLCVDIATFVTPQSWHQRHHTVCKWT